ncbi:hypothetical protein GPJ56_004157 [Histomonas meleagridis]|uniref:uncharacterized protein n=1 Tax=Histomonas meleagridis TaxID=135588 RepID=UPI00355943D6|nr:hypothetical protein GPJ56_004157 [Histomonas meleagridis]KAH0801498.1 hypothetical protein GO595_005750 [Histomonas meleagridis]
MVPNRTFDNDIISRLLHSISSIQVSLQSFELIKESILNMSQLMLLRGYIEESFFDYFKDLCMCYQEMNDLYPYIFANFIIPSLQYEDPPLSSIFLMISKFYPSVIDLEWLVQISIPALSDLRSNVNDSCLIALSNYFYLSNPDQLKLTIDSVIAPLLTSIFQGISDSMHQQSYFRYVDFLQGLINIYTHLNTYNDNNFKQLLVNIMSQTMKEPQSGFFEQFVNYIIASQSSSYDFKNAFINLLITLRKLSPGDTNLFKVEPLRSSSIFKMLFDQMLNGKGAFVFSLPGMFELEIKPQQQNGDNQNK